MSIIVIVLLSILLLAVSIWYPFVDLRYRIRAVWGAMISTAWLIVGWLLAPDAGLLCGLIALAVLLGVAGISHRWLWHIAPGADLIHAVVLNARSGRDALVKLEIIAPDDDSHYRTHWDGHILTFTVPRAGMTLDRIRKKVDTGLPALGFGWAEVSELGPGSFRAVFAESKPPAVTDTVHVVKTVPPMGSDASVRYGIWEDGSPATLSFRELNGVLLAGESGSGKSAGAIMLVLPLLLSPLARVHVLDGKGGMEWDWCRPYADTYINDAIDYETVADRLETLVDAMNESIARHPWDATDPDYWHHGPTPETPMNLVVLDECQLWLGTGETDRERKTRLARIQQAVWQLITRGRSAGWCVLLMTQRPTIDAIPSRLRDNIARRICLRVRRQESVMAVLGELPDEGEADPRGIRFDQPGLAVTENGEGRLAYVRFDYMSVSDARHALEERDSKMTVSGG
ncbi:ftsK [Bifidobacterium tissieri]|uniref:FtsK n=1 Tax=Bifidobacterium tissieri TaxID=1630162 RepID=A0A261FGM6_9BIFI|nr:zonular occludens toxin domain-containing protein [Bifidobacterium tissieri]OZG58289.1 ftsK [Bifidobacterium tissieri]